MGDTLRILFVCTGNVFRSITAEHYLKKHLKEQKITNVKVSSAGIITKKDPMHKIAINILETHGIPKTLRRRRKLTKKILEENDVVISMSTNHQLYIQKKYNKKTLLYNTFATGKQQAVLDAGEIPKQKSFKLQSVTKKTYEKHLAQTITHIHKTIPQFWKTTEKHYLLFSRFLEKKTVHQNGYQPEILYETKHSAAFMSIDIPATEDGHVLVIPKKRYAQLEDIPPHIQTDLMKTVTIIGKALMKTHEGYNILLNNGSAAGQYIFHTHFHLIPRNKKDKIQIEVWKRRKKMNKKTFHKLNKNMKKHIQNVLRKQ